jgi:uncharacterized protein (DUF427 family)
MRPQRIAPGPGQESVWDYPRPPRVEPATRRVRIVLAGLTIAESDRALRVLETSHPPAYYVPVSDLRHVDLRQEALRTVCEFKGRAAYWALEAGGRLAREAAWSYPDPSPGYEALADHLTVYPDRVDACYLDDERVEPQPGGFYGGWITSEVVGPFKGGPGTWGW